MCLLGFLVGCGEHTSAPLDAGADGPSAPPAIAFFSRADPSADWAPTTRAFFGDEIDVRLSGLPPSSAITLVADSADYRSTTSFHTDANGAVDVATLAPDPGGAYTGADVDGPFWTMTNTSSTPGLEDFPVTFSVTVGDQTVVTQKLDRYWGPDDATVKNVTDSGLVGVFVTPSGPGPFPALVTFGGSEGGLSTGRMLAEYYASLGYACLGLAYFGAPGLPQDLANIPLEYFGTALDWLKQQPEIDPARIGVMGGSRGGELALLLGATYPDIKAVVATSPSGLVWGGATDVTKPAWTHGGNAVPFVPASSWRTTTSTDPDGNTLYAFAPSFLDDIHDASPAALDAATIAVDQIQGSVLLLAGMDDQLWAGCTLSQYAVDRLKSSGHWQAHGDDFQCYAETGHLILQPGVPTNTANESYDPVDHSWWNLGGTAVGTAHADRDADTRIRAFLKQHL